MNFKDNTEAYFEEAVHPIQDGGNIKRETNGFNDIAGYVYIIGKRFPPYDNNKNMDLLKVGYSDIGTDGKLGRLDAFRTTLINYKVYRIYLFRRLPTGKSGARAAEGKLHKKIDNDFEPRGADVRIKHSTGTPSEWWEIKPKYREKFLDFCDDEIEHLDVQSAPIYATKFYKTGTSVLKFGSRSERRVRYDAKGKLIELDESRSRKTNEASYTRGLRARESRAAEDVRIAKAAAKAKAAVKKKPELETRGPAADFWAKVLVGKKFFDDDMYDDDPVEFGGNRIITDVVWDREKTKVKGKWKYGIYQPMVVFEPDVRQAKKAGGDKAKQKRINAASGYMVLPEVLNLYFPKLKKKYKAGYEIWKKKNKYNEEESSNPRGAKE